MSYSIAASCCAKCQKFNDSEMPSLGHKCDPPQGHPHGCSPWKLAAGFIIPLPIQTQLHFSKAIAGSKRLLHARQCRLGLGNHSWVERRNKHLSHKRSISSNLFRFWPKHAEALSSAHCHLLRRCSDECIAHAAFACWTNGMRLLGGPCGFSPILVLNHGRCNVIFDLDVALVFGSQYANNIYNTMNTNVLPLGCAWLERQAWQNIKMQNNKLPSASKSAKTSKGNYQNANNIGNLHWK